MWLPLPCLCLLASSSADAGSNSKDGQIFGDKNSACFSAQETVSVFFLSFFYWRLEDGITSSICETTDSVPHGTHHKGGAFLFRQASEDTFHVLKHIITHIYNRMRISKHGLSCLENVYHEGKAADRATSSNSTYNYFISIHEHYPLALITPKE